MQVIRRSQLFLTAWALAVMSGSGACGVLSVEEPTASGMCAQDSDCAEGLRCYDQRLCVVRQSPAFAVQARLTPPSGSGKIVEQFALQLDAAMRGDTAALMLGEPALVRGTVKRAGSSTLAASIPGTLVASAQSQDGTALNFQVASFATLQSFAGSPTKQGFELRVQPGYTYTVVFRPEAAELIPPHTSNITVGGSIDNWKIELPSEDKLLRVRGRLLAGGVPLVGLRAFLIDDEGKLDSTRALVDGKGEFALWVDPAAKPGRLRFEPVDLGSALPQGETVGEIDIHKAALKGEPLDLGDLDLGAIGPASAVTLTAAAGGQPESGALVRVQRLLKAETQGVKAWIEVHGHTDDEGRWSAELPPGPMVVSVIPEVHSAAARWSAKVKGESGQLAIELGKRPVVMGQVLDYRQRPVAQATLRMRRVTTGAGEIMAGSTTLGEAEIQGTTDAQGRFAMPADLGGWWLWVAPRPQDGLPRVLAAQVDLTAGSVPPQLAVVVPAPVLLVGRTLTAKGVGLAGVAVDILAQQALHPLIGSAGAKRAGMPLPGADIASSQNRLIGSATSGNGGVFEVLLAPPQAQP
jgi:hypothetical protein